MLSCLCPKIQWKNWSINVTVYLKLVYIEFAKNVAHNYRIWLELLNIFLHNFYSRFALCCNANKEWSEEINI